MTVLGIRLAEWSTRAGTWRRLAAAAIAGLVAAGCEHAFEPFQENEAAIFSMFGYLDLKADTQWLRVMPVRQDLVLDPGPIDAVVTLEHLGSGRRVTLNDSLVGFFDARLDGVAYAHNFWTTERIEPGATYRVRATRSDGASTTALVVMPPELEIRFVQDAEDARHGETIALLHVRAEHLLFAEMVYAMGQPNGRPAVPFARRDGWTFSTGVPNTLGIGLKGDTLRPPGLLDMRRLEIRLAVAPSGWPYHPDLSDVEVILPSTMPSNVENGVGFVGGVAAWVIPADECEVLATSAERQEPCTTVFSAESASISGRLIREPCGGPHPFAEIRLTERSTDGAAVLRWWKTDWDGRYRFEGLKPGSDLALQLGPGGPVRPLPRLAPGQRYSVPDLSVAACG